MKSLSKIRSLHREGFTLVELMVVVVAIIILSTIAVSSYIQQQRRAQTETANSVAATVSSGAEKYYIKNGEYPSTYTLTGSDGTGSYDATFHTAARALSTTTNALKAGGWILSVCGEDSGIPSYRCTSAARADSAPNYKQRMFYIARYADDGSPRTFSISASCSVSFAGTTPLAIGNSAYAIAFLDPADSTKWYVKKSTNGTVTHSGAGCKIVS